MKTFTTTYTRFFKYLLCSIVVLLQYIIQAQNYPLSDPKNTGRWILNSDISDEFDNEHLNEEKWLIQGKNGVYKSNFIGRAPSQFSIHNALVEDGKLKIRTKWDPSFPFTNDASGNMLGVYNGEPKPITTAAVISKKQFQYGYMEIKAKAANAEITSAFWTTGPGVSHGASELDMFEMFGGHKTNDSWKKRLKFNMISWDPNNSIKQAATAAGQAVGTTHTRNIQADHNTADDFHIYGFEWTTDYIKVFIDGVLHPNGTILKSAITNNGSESDRWVTNVPYWVWFDSETFPWLGLPDEDDLAFPVDYEIEYIRVWQNNNLINTDFFGFESTINIDNTEKDWYIPGTSSSYLSISEDNSYGKEKSLKFTHTGEITNNAVAFAPFGALNLDTGNFELSLKVRLVSGSSLKSFQIILENPYQILNFNTTGLEPNTWVTLSQNFTRNLASGDTDRLRFKVTPTDAETGSSTLYIDDIYISKVSTLSSNQFNKKIELSKVYPNPINTATHKHIKIASPQAKQLSICNITGSQIITYNKTSDPMEIDISQLKPGIYFIKIQSNTATETKKLIIKNN